MESVWSRSVTFKEHKQLQGDISVNTAVIGAGIAGLLTAYRLKEKGIDTVVIDANTVCSGQTKNTTAKITSQHGVIYSKILNYYGEESAKQYAELNQKAIEDYEKLIKEKGISCHFERKSAYLYTMGDEKKIFKEAAAAHKAGIPCSITDKTELPFSVKAALVFENQAQFNPLEFLNVIADELKIYENTQSTKIIDNVIYTNCGTITAENIVLACHYPFVNFPGLYFMRMSQERSYVVSAEYNRELNGMYIDADGGLSLRSYGNRLILGGGAHRTGCPNDADPFKTLENAGKRLFGDFNVDASWSAQDCITLDNIPYIGRFSSAAPNMFVMTGFCKWGMTTSMVAANLVSDMISGEYKSDFNVFSPTRLSVFATAGNACVNTAETVKGFAKYLRITAMTEKDVKNSSAAVIRYNGKNAGAYRDENGKLYIVSLKCPHLKCTLNWNESTKTWDCPCHGSRYDYKGALIDNPAQHMSILLN